MNNMNLNDTEKLVSIVQSSVTIVAILVGGVFGLVQYMDYKSSEKVNRSLTQLTKYSADGMVKSRESINEAWSDNLENLIELFKKNKSDEAYSKFVIDVVSNNNLDNDVDKILRFYEESAVCVNSNLCDEETIRSFFQTDAKPFFNTFYPYICSQRKRWKDEKIWETVQAFYNPKSIGKICG